MSGHSKWSTIKRQKGVADVKRGQTFTKLANVITLAARLGNSGDPNSNPRLRMALETARASNMPKENVQRAIDRGLGKLPGQILEEVSYEGFGPGKVAFYLEAVTDNKNRSLAEIRNLFDRAGGSIGSSGSVAYMFDKKGEIRARSKGTSVEDELLELIDLGADDVEDYEDEGITKYLIYTDSTAVADMSNKVTQYGYEVEEYGIVFKPNINTEISDPELAKRVVEFAQRLEDHEDVQKVYANMDIPEGLM